MEDQYEYKIESVPENLAWGHFDATRSPVATVPQDRAIEIETVTAPQPDHQTFLTSEGISSEDILSDELRVAKELSRTGPGPHVVTGPIAVAGAEPGDVLEVRVKDVRLRAPYGINLFKPDSGTLPQEFPFHERRVIPFDLVEDVAQFADGISVPLNPFLGIMAVASAGSETTHTTSPPDYFGGNLDLARLTEGSTLYLPVHRKGALFWAGDGHGIQGNGEVCLTAAETSLTAVLEFDVHSPKSRLGWPVAETGEYYILLGFDTELNTAVRNAVKNCIAFLSEGKGVSEADAYRLSSVAVDFNITQVVNGTKGVHALIPKSIFRDDSPIDPTELT